MSTLQDKAAGLRKHTVFEPCEAHTAMYAEEPRYRRAEAMAEGGWCSPCRERKCQMKPGTDFFCPSFIEEHPVYKVENDYGVDYGAGAADRLRTYELDKGRDAYVVRDTNGQELTEFFEDEWQAQQFCANGMSQRVFKIVQRRRWVLIAEDLGCGDFTARWFFDKQDQRWHLAESWKRAARPICDRDADRIAGIILRSKIVRG